MPKVGIIMGSDSDLKVMSKAAVMLEELGIEYEMTIISAHREPDELIECDQRSRRPWNQGYDRRCRNGSSPSGNVCSIICPCRSSVYLYSGKNLGWNEMQCSQSCRCRREFRLQPLRSTEQRMQQFLQQRFLQLQMKNF